MKKKNKKVKSNWDVSHEINPNGSVCVFSIVNDKKTSWLKRQTYYFSSVEEARLSFIEETLSEGLRLETLEN